MNTADTPRGTSPGPEIPEAHECECTGKVHRKPYALQDHEGRWSVALYCPDCAMLAKVDTSGTVARCVGPLLPENTGGNCEALAYGDAATFEDFYITATAGAWIPGDGERFTLWRTTPDLDPVELCTGTLPS